MPMHWLSAVAADLVAQNVFIQELRNERLFHQAILTFCILFKHAFKHLKA